MSRQKRQRGNNPCSVLTSPQVSATMLQHNESNILNRNDIFDAYWREDDCCDKDMYQKLFNIFRASCKLVDALLQPRRISCNQSQLAEMVDKWMPFMKYSPHKCYGNYVFPVARDTYLSNKGKLKREGLYKVMVLLHMMDACWVNKDMMPVHNLRYTRMLDLVKEYICYMPENNPSVFVVVKSIHPMMFELHFGHLLSGPKYLRETLPVSAEKAVELRKIFSGEDVLREVFKTDLGAAEEFNFCPPDNLLFVQQIIHTWILQPGHTKVDVVEKMLRDVFRVIKEDVCFTTHTSCANFIMCISIDPFDMTISFPLNVAAFGLLMRSKRGEVQPICEYRDKIVIVDYLF